jgi:hypothetical protein
MYLGRRNMTLGNLKKVDLREAWKNEANDFTEWLSEEENLALLGDEISIDIKLLKTEAETGRYSVDILCEEENTGRKIIIENQLEITNHDHLGKVITYASGHEAEIAIWIVKDVRDEHKQAIDWLNEHTDEKINFFAIKMELWQINNSEYAPKFQIIAKPNEWVKALKKSSGQSSLTDTKLMQLVFWNKFREYAESKGAKIRLRKPRPQHWYSISFGSSDAHINLIMNTQEDTVGCEIYITDSKEMYNHLFNNKNSIEKELNDELHWKELPMKKASRIQIFKEADFENVDAWEDYFDWMNEKAENFQKVFSKYIKKLE